MWVEHYGELASPTLDAFKSLGFALAMTILAHGAAYFIAMERLT